MIKPTHYLWKRKEISEEEIQAQKEYFIQLGYRTVIFREGDKELQDAFMKIIKNHMENSDT
jgi:hypothetical protein